MTANRCRSFPRRVMHAAGRASCALQTTIRSRGTISIHAIDDGGAKYGPVDIGIDAGETLHVNSDDLEDGNAAKGLVGSTGRPRQGDWRLEVRSGLRIEVLSFVRTRDGFVTPMHAVAPLDAAASLKYRIVNFNPARDLDQQSLLRLVNRTAREAAVLIEAMDDTGMRGGRVRLAVPAGASRTLGAMELEQGGDFEGSFGTGSGKWRLEVWSDVPVSILSLLATPTGHLTNWSATPGPAGGAMRPPPPSVTVVSPTLVEAEWVGSFEGLFASFDLSVKYREGDEWELFLGCADFTGSTRTTTHRLTAAISLGAPAEVGRVLWVRYRHRNESFCFSDQSSPGAWSHTGEALIRDAGVAPSRNPDLAVLVPSVDDPVPEAGGKFSLSATVWNAGDEAAAATTLRYYRSSNRTISTNDMEVGRGRGRRARGRGREQRVDHPDRPAGIRHLSLRCLRRPGAGRDEHGQQLLRRREGRGGRQQRGRRPRPRRRGSVRGRCKPGCQRVHHHQRNRPEPGGWTVGFDDVALLPLGGLPDLQPRCAGGRGRSRRTPGGRNGRGVDLARRSVAARHVLLRRLRGGRARREQEPQQLFRRGGGGRLGRGRGGARPRGRVRRGGRRHA